jgi:hypothetical protein
MEEKIREVSTLDDLLALCKEISVKVKLEKCGGIWWYVNWCSGRCANYKTPYLELVYGDPKTDSYLAITALYVLEGEGFIKVLERDNPPQNCSDFGKPIKAKVKILKTFWDMVRGR